MVIAALATFAILLVAWILAPGETAQPEAGPIAVELEPEPEAVPLAA